MVMSSVLSLLKNIIRFKAYGNIDRRLLENSHGIAIATAQDNRNIENKHTYDCLAALAVTSDVILAKICIDMIYRDLYRR